MRVACFPIVALLMLGCATVLIPDQTEAAINTQGFSMNGNQELVADPSRPIVYAADFDGYKVHSFNATTGEELWNVSVGYEGHGGPLSMDFSPDGRYMYVAVAGAMNVTVIDLETRTVSRTIGLSFSPISVRVGLSGRLYLTQTYALDVIHETSGNVIEELGGFGDCTLEMSPDRTMLLVLQLGSSPTPLYKYDCSGPNLVLLDQDGGNLGANARQMAVDWTNGTIYLVNGSPYGVEVVSLATLDLMGIMQVAAYPSGVALSPDHQIVYCTTSTGESSLWAFSASNWSLIAKYQLREPDATYIDPSTYAAVAAPRNAGSVVAIGHPVIFLNLSRPALFPGFPRIGENVGYDYYGLIEADVFMGVPPVEITSYRMTLDGVEIAASFTNQTIVGLPAGLISDGGNHSVHASIGWNGGTESLNWTFRVSEVEHVVSETPARDSTLNYIPDKVTVVLDLGYPKREWSGGWIALNGNPGTPWTMENGTIVISTSYMGEPLVLPGRNTVSVEIHFAYADYMQTLYSDLYLSYEFSVVDVPTVPSSEGLGWHNLSGIASLMLPTSWEQKENVNASGVQFAIQAIDPQPTTPRRSISLQVGIDPAVATGETYLNGFPDEFVAKMNTSGYRVYIIEGPRSELVSGRPAIVFAIRWTDQPVVQKLMIVTDTNTSRFWLMIMTTEESMYFDSNPMFEGVVSSFSPISGTDGPPDGNDTPGTQSLLIYVLLGAAIAAGVVVLVAVLYIWSQRKIPPTPPPA